MTQLTTLSNELLETIFTHLAHDKPALCALAAANHRLSDIARLLIVRHLEVWVVSPEPTQTNSYDHLLRTLASSSYLTMHVRSVKLQRAGDIAWEKPIPHIANARANALLAQLPNIQELEIANYSQSCSPFIADFFNTTQVAGGQDCGSEDVCQ